MQERPAPDPDLVPDARSAVAGGRPAAGPPNTPPQLADRPVANRPVAGREPDQPANDRELARELRSAGDWRRTSRGPAPDLAGANLSGEDLRGVDFTGANLRGADLSNAKLADARFASARLAHADLSGATGVLGEQFARADLRGARLPEGVRFGAVDTANEVAQGTGKLLLTVLLVCAYSWLTINSTLDAKLLTDTAVSNLPILNAQIPIVNFYALVPLALVGLALVVMLQAQRLWTAMAAAPDALPDGTTMADRASAWLLGPWAVDRVVSAERRTLLVRLQALLAAAVGWWVVPLTVGWFWLRYLHRHDWTVTSLHLLALTVGCTAAAAFLGLANATLPRRRAPRAPTGAATGAAAATTSGDDTGAARGARRGGPSARLYPFAPAVAALIAVPIFFGVTSYAAIHGVHRITENGVVTEQTSGLQPAVTLEHVAPALQVRLPQLMSSMGIRPVADLAEAEVSTRLPTASAESDTGAGPKASGAHLVGADLRFAAGERVFLALSDLRRADLLGADLWSADLRGANLVGASLVGSLLYGADLRKVRANAAAIADRVDTANGIVYVDTLLCSRASFAAANVRYARLGSADLRGASFDGALLEGATFPRARLQHATFGGADLDGADFRKAYGLTVGQVLAARHVGALYDSTLLAELKVRSPDRFAGYNAAAIDSETARERLSGEDEPDTLDVPSRHERDALVRMAFDSGAAGAPPAAAVDHWTARGHAAPTSTNGVPYGCVLSRSTVVAARPR